MRIGLILFILDQFLVSLDRSGRRSFGLDSLIVDDIFLIQNLGLNVAGFQKFCCICNLSEMAKIIENFLKLSK